MAAEIGVCSEEPEDSSRVFCCSLCESEYCLEEKLRCTSCDYADLCETCVKSHLKKSHEIVDYLGRTPLSCDKHNLLLSLYCETCKVTFCLACSQNHSMHKFQSVKDKVSGIKKEVFDLIDKSEVLVKPLKKVADQIAELKVLQCPETDKVSLNTNNVMEMVRNPVESACTSVGKCLDSLDQSFCEQVIQASKYVETNDEMTCELQSWLSLSDSQLLQRYLEKNTAVQTTLDVFAKATDESFHCVVSSHRVIDRSHYEKQLFEAVQELILPENVSKMTMTQKTTCIQMVVNSDTGRFKNYIESVGHVFAVSSDQNRIEILKKDHMSIGKAGKTLKIDDKIKLPTCRVFENKSNIVFIEALGLGTDNVKLHYENVERLIEKYQFNANINSGDTKEQVHKEQLSAKLTEEPNSRHILQDSISQESSLPKRRVNPPARSSRPENPIMKSQSSKYPQIHLPTQATSVTKSTSGSFQFKFHEFLGQASAISKTSPSVDKAKESLSPKFVFQGTTKVPGQQKMDGGAGQSNENNQRFEEPVTLKSEIIDRNLFGGELENIVAVRFLSDKSIGSEKFEFLYWDKRSETIVSSLEKLVFLKCERKPCAALLSDNSFIMVEMAEKFHVCSVYELIDGIPAKRYIKLSFNTKSQNPNARSERWQIVDDLNENHTRFIALVNLSQGLVIALFKSSTRIPTVESVDCGFSWKLAGIIDLKLKDVEMKFVSIKNLNVNEATNKFKIKLDYITTDNKLFVAFH